jgi:phosphoribosylformimino-5-aminoimidazole carboxamide ribotide isomerase
MQIIPAIDLKGGRCVRLTQGRKTEETIYDADPVETAASFASAGVEMIHVVDLDGAFSGKESSNRAIVNEIVERVDVRVEFGGGIRSIADVQRVINCGVARVVLGTLATESTDTLRELVALFASQVCVGIDALEGQVMSRGWETATRTTPIDLARSVAGMGVERIIYTDIKRDGMMTGPNIEQTLAIAREAQIHVTASGGVSSLDDIKRLRDAGEPLVDSVIVGKALYEGKIRLEEAMQFA